MIGVRRRRVFSTDPNYKPLQSSHDWVQGHAWKTLETAAGHDAMVIAPDRLAEMLESDTV